jgi:hypothetical protein
MADGLDTAISNSFILVNDEVVIVLLAIPLYYRAVYIYTSLGNEKRFISQFLWVMYSLLHLLRLDGPA